MIRDKGMAAVGTKIHFARSKGSQTTMCGKRIDAQINQEATVNCKRCLHSVNGYLLPGDTPSNS